MHFFSEEAEAVQTEIKKLIGRGYRKGDEQYRRACARFSEQYYLGFSVIKPLDGCPVGRTVLRPYDARGDGDFARDFPCTLRYKAHFCGIELTIEGLAFQQQDIGVSACATTALWCALQKVRGFEELGQATPAQITRLASQYTLPFGRSMPSEGLSTDQMCQAIQALGISPNLIRATEHDTARGYLYSACKSQFAQVLILENPRNRDEAHAVTAAGMKTAASGEPLMKTVVSESPLMEMLSIITRFGKPPLVPASILF